MGCEATLDGGPAARIAAFVPRQRLRGLRRAVSAIQMLHRLFAITQTRHRARREDGGQGGPFA